MNVRRLRKKYKSFIYVNCEDEKANGDLTRPVERRNAKTGLMETVDVVVQKGAKHYFRLYGIDDTGIPKLIDQNTGDRVDMWEKELKAELSFDNPYAELD